MSKLKSKTQLLTHKNQALNKINTYIDTLINSPSPSTRSKADKLSYWVEDYARFLKKEQTFNPSKNIKYHRGDIVKVHLGYRIGSEEGGLHFGVVLDANNAKSSGIITIVPLTSVKENKAVRYSSVCLDTELFDLINDKHDSLHADVSKQLTETTEQLTKIKTAHMEDISVDEIDSLNSKIEFLRQKITELDEISKSISSMKLGSIALVDQITTISKIRIYDPVYSKSVLYKIRLSDKSLDLIDNKLKELFFKKSK